MGPGPDQPFMEFPPFSKLRRPYCHEVTNNVRHGQAKSGAATRQNLFPGFREGSSRQPSEQTKERTTGGHRWRGRARRRRRRRSRPPAPPARRPSSRLRPPPPTDTRTHRKYRHPASNGCVWRKIRGSIGSLFVLISILEIA